MCVRFNPDGSLIATGLADGAIKVGINYNQSD